MRVYKTASLCLSAPISASVDLSTDFLSYTTFSKDIFAFFVQFSFEIVFLNIVFPESFTTVSVATAPISTALIFSDFRTFMSFFTSFVTIDNALSKNALTSILRFLRSIAAPCFNTFLRVSQAQIRSFTSGLSKTRRSFSNTSGSVFTSSDTRITPSPTSDDCISSFFTPTTETARSNDFCPSFTKHSENAPTFARDK